MTCLLLRPDSKVEQSCQYLTRLGLDVVGLPLLRIVSEEDEINRWQDFANQSKTQSLIVIVTSEHAVKCALPLTFDWPTSWTLLSIGERTKAALARHNIDCEVAKQADSEGILQMSALSEVTNQSVALLKGVGGRDLIQQSLQSKGAQVHSFALYSRQFNPQAKSTRAFSQAQIKTVIATSGELMQAAFRQLDPAWLRQLHWIVVSERVASLAKDLGIGRITVSHGASDETLANTLIALNSD